MRPTVKTPLRDLESRGEESIHDVSTTCRLKRARGAGWFARGTRGPEHNSLKRLHLTRPRGQCGPADTPSARPPSDGRGLPYHLEPGFSARNSVEGGGDLWAGTEPNSGGQAAGPVPSDRRRLPGGGGS